MTQQGIYVSPDDTKPNRDRAESGLNNTISKDKILSNLKYSMDELGSIIIVEPSVDIAKKLVEIKKRLRETITYLE